MKKFITISIMFLFGFLFCSISFGLPSYTYQDGKFLPLDASAAALSSRSLDQTITPPVVVKVKVNNQWVWAVNIGAWENAASAEIGSNKPITEALARITTFNSPVTVGGSKYYVIPGSSGAWDSSIKSRDLVGVAKMVESVSDDNFVID